MILSSNLGEARHIPFPLIVTTNTGAYPARTAAITRYISGGLSGRGVAVSTYLHLVPKLRIGRAIDSYNRSQKDALFLNFILI